MRKTIGSCVFLVLAGVQSAAAAAPSAACVRLSDSFDLLDRNIAMNDAEGFGDDSAPRATLRELRNLNDRTQQMMLLDIMRAQSCPLPGSADGSALYAASALQCKLAEMKGTADAPECNIANWIRTDRQKPQK